MTVYDTEVHIVRAWRTCALAGLASDTGSAA